MSDQNYDISINEAKAKIWITEVTNELESVDALLKKVTRIGCEIPGENDTIFMTINKFCNIMATAWNNMCDVFRDTQNLLSKTIDHVTKSTEEVIDDIETLIHKFGR